MQRHLGKFDQLSPDFNLNQIGSTWVVTAAHCLYKDGELVAAKSLSIMLGLHDRSKKSEPKRCHIVVYRDPAGGYKTKPKN